MAIVLAEKQIIRILEQIGVDQIMDDLHIKLTQGIFNFSNETIFCPERAGFNYTKPTTGLIEWMPLYDSENHHIAIKTVGYHPDNPSTKNLPTILSNTALYDANTGELRCIFESTLATAMRTGAATAVASKALAHPESKSFGFIGCGAQSITQLHALSRVFDIQEVLYFDVNAEVQNTFEERCEALSIEAKFLRCSIKEIVATCDVVTTATTIDVGAGPLFSQNNAKPHAHFNAVGSDFPGKIELPKSLLESGFVCPDHLDQARKEGECQQLNPEQIGATLSEVIQNATQYNVYQDQQTIFDSTGWSFEDWIVMELFMSYADELGLNKEFEMNKRTSDVKNPYANVSRSIPSNSF